jgi:hypothetical protein
VKIMIGCIGMIPTIPCIDKENLGTILFYYYEFFPRLWCYCIIYVLHKQERMMPWPILMNVANSSVRSAFDSANIMNNHSENESKRLYFRERYKNMTTDERKVRHERQRLHNSEPRSKEALKLSNKKFREVQKHMLNKESIAMENTMYILEIAWPTTNASISPSNWVIPESSATHLRIPQADEDMNEDGSPSHMTHRCTISFGQRHALLTRRNTLFGCRIGGNTRSATNDCECLVEDHVDDNMPLSQSVVINSGKH